MEQHDNRLIKIALIQARAPIWAMGFGVFLAMAGILIPGLSDRKTEMALDIAKTLITGGIGAMAASGVLSGVGRDKDVTVHQQIDRTEAETYVYNPPTISPTPSNETPSLRTGYLNSTEEFIDSEALTSQRGQDGRF